MSTFLKDLRLAERSLRRRPGFAGVVVVTLALGIGATSGILSVVNAVLLRPLPYAEPDRLVRFMGLRDGRVQVGATISYPDFVDWRDRSTVFAAAAAYDEWQPNLTGVGDPERLEAAQVSASFFEVLGVEPAAGRFFVPEEDFDGRDRVVVLTHALWQRRFGGDPAVVGRTLSLSARPHMVVGVAPADFEDPLLSGRRERPQLFRPLGFDGLPAEDQPSRSGRSFVAVGRLRHGVTLDEAQAELATITAALGEEYPEDHAGQGMMLMPFFEQMVGGARRSLVLLLAAVGFVLAIAAANVGNLLLGRATDRRGEIALRSALGAGRGRLLQQFVSESLVLAAAGGALGLALAAVTTRVLTPLAAEALPRAEGIAVDLRVLGFTALTTLATAAICGMVPAFLATADLQAVLRGAAGGIAGARPRHRLRSALVVAEVALSLLLLTSAGLLLRSFWKLHQVDSGIETSNVLTFDLAPPYASYPGAEPLKAFYGDLLPRLAAVPGVEAVAAVNILPLSGGFDGNAVTADDQPTPPPGEILSVQTRTVTPGYLEVMGLKLLRGRWLAGSDVAGGHQVTVVNRALAEHFWPGEDPIGKRLTAHDTSCEVVGVVADVKHLSLAEASPPRAYFTQAQAVAWWQMLRTTLVARTAGEPLVLVPAMRREVWAVDANLPLAKVGTLEDVAAASISRPRLRTILLLSFAALALALAAVGIYGVLSYAVAERRRELAIRMALGAGSARVRRQVIRQALTLVGTGLALGLLGSLAVAPLLESLLFGVTATDPVSFAAVPLVLLAVALAASYLPARRATQIDPMATLRS